MMRTDLLVRQLLERDDEKKTSKGGEEGGETGAGKASIAMEEDDEEVEEDGIITAGNGSGGTGTGGKKLGKGVKKAFKIWLKSNRTSLSKETRAHYAMVVGQTFRDCVRR